MSSVWDRTTEFLSDNLGSVVTIAVLTIFLPGSIQANLVGVAAVTAPQLPVLFQLLTLALWLVSLLGGLALIALALGAAVGTGSALSLAARRFSLMLLVWGLLFVLCLVLALPLAIILWSGKMALVHGQPAFVGTPDPALMLGFSLYNLTLLVLFAWLFSRLAVVSAVVVAEDRGLSALGRSWRLTRGATLKIIGVGLLYGVVFFVSALATRTVVGTLLRLLTGDDGPLSTATVVTSILTGAVTTAFTVLAYVFSAKLYLALGGPETAQVDLD